MKRKKTTKMINGINHCQYDGDRFWVEDINS